MTKWNPPADVVTHAGTPLEPDMQFIVPPPAEIGDVQTAWSTIGSKQDISTQMHLLLCAGVALLVFAILGAIAYFSFENTKEMPQILIGSAVIGLIVGVIAFLTTKTRHYISYVGNLGAARYFFKRPEDGPTKTEILVYANARDLVASQTQNFTNGIYSGTVYSFRWKDGSGRDLLKVAGTYHSKAGTPKPKDVFNFACSIENAYNHSTMDRFADEFERNGSIQFPVGRGNSVRVGDGFLEFDFGGKRDRVEASDIKRLSIQEGTFYVDTHEARFFGSKGKFRFQYSEMSNAQVFLFAMEQLAGFQID